MNLRLLFLLLVLIPCFAHSQANWFLDLFTTNRQVDLYYHNFDSDQSVQSPALPKTLGIGFGFQKRHASWKRGWEIQLQLTQQKNIYTKTYAFPNNEMVQYQVHQLIYGYGLDLGYRMTYYPNTKSHEDSETLTGTSLVLFPQFGMYRYTIPGIEDSVQNQQVFIKGNSYFRPFMTLFLGLQQDFPLGSSNDHFNVSFGANGFLSAENGLYTRLHYRLGVAYHFQS